MPQTQNSRRNFLSTIAILSAGTAMAGSPATIFSSKDKTVNLQHTWKLFIKNAGAKEYQGQAILSQDESIMMIKGHLHEAGKLVAFEKENLLAQPTWIYWQNNRYQPADVIIHVFENKPPYNKLRTLNRFELDALSALSKKPGEVNLFPALCNRKGAGNKTHAIVKTRIQKKSPIQEVSFFENESLLRKEKLFYNA